MPWAPAATPVPPCALSQRISFGSFNNTAKLSEDVFDAWAQILTRVANSRLILKWRTFNDEAFRRKIHTAFEQRGIAPERVELRGPSFHMDLLREYADVDVALDPFPFTGGMTSCEALWMGVPVVTWPQSRTVSRQTHALLHQVGLPELSASSAEDYVRISVDLAHDPMRIAQLRSTLRSRMGVSSLMDVAAFTSSLEEELITLHRRTAEMANKKLKLNTVLHVGAGHRLSGAKLPMAFRSSEWKEIRFDIDPSNDPDIVGSMLDMAVISDGSVDAVYSAHNIEHIYAHEVPKVLEEFFRMLKPEGLLVVTCPDLQSVCEFVVQNRLGDLAYTSQAGPITPHDILYGHSASIAAGHIYMAHKCGFTLKTLTQAVHAAGFASSAGMRRSKELDLWLAAVKSPTEESTLRELAEKFLPKL